MTTETSTPVSESHRARGTLFILVASTAFASSGPLAKPVMQAGFAPEQVASARAGLAALMLLVGVAVVRPSVLRVRREHWRVVVAYGLIGVAAVQFLFFLAVSRLPVGVAMLLEYTSPVLVALWVRFVRRVRLPALSWLGTGLALGGLALVSQVWSGLALDAVGLLAGVGAALCSAGYYLLGEKGAGEQHPIGMVTWGMAVGAAGLFVLAPPWEMPLDRLGAPARLGGAELPIWVLLVTVAAVSTAIAYALSTTSLRDLPSQVASVLALSEPVVATLLAWLLLGEVLEPVQIAGMVVLLGGALLVQLATRTPVTPAEPLPTK
ncbi:EamA family transporter [Actinokineospora cianjurensis]|uniref:Threonine/homoserine efflux transporter RhtA n=1 Tax=Actinokineospora cianjurensis TaxID=585224 RepID=A0A421BCV5_9PSEU|nr:EamA family transporter [Actinokineospora cianjurensis]RLK62140.1 threonine/homoserine efflux transporter RhtA [Actinokineospora cianjurensis]